ncbi:hypothetical protein D3C72_937300 [compost metagenome]
MHGVFKEQSKVSIIGNDNHIDASFSCFIQSVYNFFALSFPGGVTSRVVREVQNHDSLAFILLCQQGFPQTGAVKGHLLCKKRVIHDMTVATDSEGQFVVLPVLVWINHCVSFTHEEIRDYAESVRESVRYNGITEAFSFQRRVLLKHLAAPYLTKLWLTSRRCIRIQVLRIKFRQRFLKYREMHRTAVLGCNPDGRIIFLGIRCGFSRLTQDSFLGEVDLSS